MSIGENFELELFFRVFVVLVIVYICECNVNCSYVFEKKKNEENFKDDLIFNFNVVLFCMDVY